MQRSKLPSKKFILTAIAILLVVVGVILTVLTPQKVGLPALTTLVPSPTPTLAFPTIVPQVDRPSLTIIWNVAPQTFPPELPYYQNTSPLLTTAYVKALAARLGFSDSDFKPDPNSKNNFLYLNGNKSLSGNTQLHQFTFTDTTMPPTGNFDNPQVLSQTALQKISSLLDDPNLSLSIASPVSYLQSNPPYLQIATQTSANYAKVSFTQNIATFPYVTSSVSNTLGTAIFDQDYNPHFFEILGGFSNLKNLGNHPLIDFVTLKQLAPTTAQIISSTGIIKTDNAIAAAQSLTLTVGQVQLAYYNLPGTDLIQPVILLTGKVIGKAIPSTPATYMVPAYTQESYP